MNGDKVRPPRWWDAENLEDLPVIAGGQGKSDYEASEHAAACLLVIAFVVSFGAGSLFGWAVYLWMSN